MSTGAFFESPSILQLLSFANRQAKSEDPNCRSALDRRDEDRRALVVPVIMQAVTLSLQILEAPLNVVTRNISLSGIGLISGDRLQHAHYTMRFSVENEEIYVLGLKVWSTPRGPFDLVGMDIIRKLDHVC